MLRRTPTFASMQASPDPRFVCENMNPTRTARSVPPRGTDLVAIRDLLTRLGENPDREGLLDTPARFVAAMSHFTSGYALKPEDVLKTFGDGSEGLEADAGMIVQANIPLWSTCEHHLLPFFGVAHVGYIPDGCIVGLSKMSRLVDVFAHRLQVQERLGAQIADAMVSHLKPKGVGVVLECRHTCMESRGIERAGTSTTTSALRGVFKDNPAARAEFLALCKRERPL
jgi:GTP cyclohydrolase I